MSLVLTLTLLMTAVTAWTGLDGEEPDYSVDNNNNIDDLLESQELESDDDDDTGNGHSDDESDADISESDINEFVDPSQFVG